MKAAYTFNFRPMSVKKQEELKATIEGTFGPDDFEVVEADKETQEPIKVKRKPVNATLELPEFVEGLDDLAKSIITDFVAGFVKNNYIDQFLPVGAHDWDLITKEAASSRGAGSISIADSTLAITAKSFGDFVAATTGQAVLGERLALVVEGKITQNAITKFLGQCDESLIDKLLVRATQWAEHVASSGDENADELADGYSYIDSKLQKLKRKLSNDISDLVAEAL